MEACANCETPLSPDSRFCPRCGTRVREMTTEEWLASGASDPTGLLERLRDAIGDEFRVLHELGRGGMGRVYLAQELALDRRVAMKVLPPAFVEHPEIVERFKREARTAGKLAHPHIVPVYQVSERDGLTFFTMPYVSGPNLRQVLKATPRPDVARVRRYLREAAGALAYAHGQGVIHRDVKPENMLLDGGPDGRLMLTDFGIAKALGAGTTLTRPGEMMGTPYYMSPELCEERETIDGRSDQYSLGLVGYEMLAGRFPFTGESMATIVYRHLFEELEPLDRVREDVDEDLRGAIARATHKDRDQRFPNMLAFAEAVDGSSRPRTVAPVAPGTSPKRSGGFRRRVIAALGALLVVGAGGAGAYYWATVGRAGATGDRSGSVAVLKKDGAASRGGGMAAGTDSTSLEPDRRISDGAVAEGGDTASPRPRLAGADADQVRQTPAPGTGRTDRKPATRRAAGEAAMGNVAETLRARLEERRLAVETARVEARKVGADTLFDVEFRRANGLFFGALGALAERRPGLALDRLASARTAFEDLTARASVFAQRPPAAPESGVAAGRDREIGSGGDSAAGDGVESARPEPAPDAAIAALLSVYARALESEDSERLRRDVYAGEIPADDARIFRLWFQNADDLEVEAKLEEVAVEGDRATGRVRQVMRYHLTRTDELRNTRLSLGMDFRRTPAGWRLVELRLR